MVMLGTPTDPMVTVWVAVAVQPLAAVTVRVTVYDPPPE